MIQTANNQIIEIGKRAKIAARAAVLLTAAERREILLAMADGLVAEKQTITDENTKDIEAARAAGISEAMLDRLLLNSGRFDSMVTGLREIAEFQDLLGQELETRHRPNGLLIRKIRVPIGVIGIIYESRPNVTADAVGLCLKTSNAVILRGGSESLGSNRAIASALTRAGLRRKMPEGMLQIIDSKDRESIKALVQLENYVDLIIPRGGEGLIRAVTELAKVPVLKHYKGVCHLYVDKSADLEKALAIVENAKCQRPGVCNALETLLVDQQVAASFLPQLAIKLSENSVELRCDPEARQHIPLSTPATEEDWHAEYLALILAVRVVPGVQAAIDHINTYGSQHTDAIIAEDLAAQQSFATQVDSGVVMLNASTRFNDGAEFGLGAEIGISTDKLHARGPVGAEGLTTYKYIVEGSGQVRN